MRPRNLSHTQFHQVTEQMKIHPVSSRRQKRIQCRGSANPNNRRNPVVPMSCWTEQTVMLETAASPASTPCRPADLVPDAAGRRASAVGCSKVSELRADPATAAGRLAIQLRDRPRGPGAVARRDLTRRTSSRLKSPSVDVDVAGRRRSRRAGRPDSERRPRKPSGISRTMQQRFGSLPVVHAGRRGHAARVRQPDVQVEPHRAGDLPQRDNDRGVRPPGSVLRINSDSYQPIVTV